jgi:Domain of unknown function (DUF5122) beta-propeller
VTFSSKNGARPGKLALTTGLVAVLMMVAAGSALAAYSADSKADAGTWGTNGRVRALAYDPVRNRIYLGGDFTAVKVPGTTQTRAASRIAAFDADTGIWIDSFDASVDGTVYALEVDPATGTVYAGGAFSNANGAARNKVAAFTSTGATESTFNITANFPVRALELGPNDTTPTKLYMGGSFTKIFKGTKGFGRARLAAISLPAHTVDAWLPKANNHVRALEISRNSGDRLYVGGDFTTITTGGTPHSQFALASLTTATGAFETAFRPEVRANPEFCGNGCVMDIATSVDSSRVFAGVGGKEPGNMLLAVDSGDGDLIWDLVGDGDFQAVEVQGDWLYGGGHFTSVGQDSTKVKFITVLAMGDDPRGDYVEEFKPTVNSSFGVWDILANPEETRTNGKLYLGGDFTKVTTQNKFRFALFTDDGTP